VDQEGYVTDPEVQKAILTIRDAARAANVKLGIYCSNAEDAKMRLEQGFTLIGLSTDLNYLGRSAGAALAAVKH
jgi:4-hydroxy-2-oxoheptanedioate aldolase